MSRVNQMSAANVFHAIYDVIMLVLVYTISSIIVLKAPQNSEMFSYSWVLLITIPIWLFLMASMRIYDKILYFGYEKLIRITAGTAISAIFVNAIMSNFVKDAVYNRKLLFVYSIMLIFVMTLFKLVFKFLATRDNAVLKSEARVIIVGMPGDAKKFVDYVETYNKGLSILGYVHIEGVLNDRGTKILGNIEELLEIVKDNQVDEVIFALPKLYFGKIEKYVLQCEEMGITVRMILDLYDMKIAKTYLTNIGTFPMLTFDTVHFNRFQLFVKRLLDIVGSLVGIFITGILSIFVVSAIKFESKGPIIFAQNRVGLNGRTFCLYKFRSMCLDAEEQKEDLESQNEVQGGLMFKMKNDPRITAVGKFLRKTSLDELPQFINVLKGDMSLVGTRPPTEGEVAKYENYQRRRISIKPGLTGMWQVSGRSSIKDFEEVVKLDTRYIDEWSLWLDVKIIVKTVLVVFGRKSGAC